MTKNTPKQKRDARYLAVLNRHAPSLEDVPHVREALEQESKKATGRTLHIKPGKAGFEFLSSNLTDEDQTLSSVAASLSGKDELPAYEFIWGMCDQINNDRNNTLEVRNAAADLSQHILYTQPTRMTHLQVNNTKEMREKLNALDDARKAQASDRSQQAGPTSDEEKQHQPGPLAQGTRPLPRRDRRQDVPPQPDTSLDAGWETVDVVMALGGHMTSHAVRSLAVTTERQLLQIRATRSLTDSEELKLQSVASYLTESALPNTHWNPMTEVRLETPPPSGYFRSPKK